jgi:prepilin peptidase CpaA
MMPKLIPVLPMLALLVWAAVEDFRTRRIRNPLTLALALSGILHSYLARGDGVTPLYAWAGLTLGLLGMLPLFALRALRGGDVKIMAGIGAWLGPVAVVQIFVIEKIVGMVIVLVQCAWQGKLLSLFRNSAVLAVNLAHVRQLGVDHVSQTGRSFRSIDRPLPYAVPLLIATLIVVSLLS